MTVRHAFYQKSFAAAVPLHPFNAASVIWGGNEAANAARQDSRAVTSVTQTQNQYRAVSIKKDRLPPREDRPKSFAIENGADDFFTCSALEYSAVNPLFLWATNGQHSCVRLHFLTKENLRIIKEIRIITTLAENCHKLQNDKI
ncbi:MAG: hypothetical protein IJ784_05435 [Ruminiclostridium sp.]|nr:hypothetical protein [Ruminiclostridium sp.]